MGSLGLNCPSCAEICAAITWKNVGRFFISPLFAAFCYFAAGLYANSVLQVVADRQVVHCGADGTGRCPPLPDLGHDVFPHIESVAICDYWLYAVVGLTFIRFSPFFVSKSLSLVMLRRWLFLQGSLFWMRGISVALTRQSVPQANCVSTATGNAWMEGLYIMTGIHVTCGDIMFSGHTAGITLCVMLWTHYSKGEEWRPCFGDSRPFFSPDLDAVGDPATCSLTAILAWAVAGTGYFFIIATRFHYSNDVFIGLILTQFVFRVYHYYIKTLLEQPGWWARIFRWFEGFDTSVLRELGAKAMAPGGQVQRVGSLRFKHGHGFPPGSPGDLGDQLGTSAEAHAERIASHNAGDANRGQAVAPLAGVAVAVFSEGPDKTQQDRAKSAAKYGEKGAVGKALGIDESRVGSGSKGNAGTARASGGGAGFESQTRILSPPRAGSINNAHDGGGGGHGSGGHSPGSSYYYHELADPPQQQQLRQSQHPQSQPVIVAGEIAKQQQERKDAQ